LVTKNHQKKVVKLQEIPGCHGALYQISVKIIDFERNVQKSLVKQQFFVVLLLIKYQVDPEPRSRNGYHKGYNTERLSKNPPSVI
jgi:hypothetical protein